MTSFEELRRDRLALMVADALSERANTVIGPLAAGRVVDELLKDPWALLDALGHGDCVPRTLAEAQELDAYDEQAVYDNRQIAKMRDRAERAERERDALRADNDRLRNAIDAVLVRCREGSRRCNWLPIIDSILSEALAGGPDGPSQSWHEHPPPPADADTQRAWDRAWSPAPPAPDGEDADAEPEPGGFHHDYGCTHDPCECSGEPSRAEEEERQPVLDVHGQWWQPVPSEMECGHDRANQSSLGHCRACDMQLEEGEES